MLGLVEKSFKIKIQYDTNTPVSNRKISSMQVYDEEMLINMFTGHNADDIFKILTGQESIKNFRRKIKMNFQIIDNNGDIVDKNLSYESALMYIDNVVGKYYIMQPMKEED